MRITKLHLIIAFLGFVCMLWGTIVFVKNRLDQKSRAALAHAQAVREAQTQRALQLREARRQETIAMERLERSAKASIAVIGETYAPLRKKFGDIPSISVPLREAKKQLGEGHYDLALAAAQSAWKAAKEFRLKTPTPGGLYEVVQGDTLWEIALRASPVRAGAGWVAIWHANQEQIPDFDKIETGWTLQIPQNRSQYIMPYWQPR